MGKDKTTTVQETKQEQQYQPTAEEQELNRLMLEQTRAAQPGVLQAQESGLNLVNQLLLGQSLPGYLDPLTSGISEEAIGQQASRLAGQYGAGFQNLGIADSGVAFRETARGIANELLFPTEQFNIGNLQNLLNLALSGQAQVQAPVMATGGQLSSNLAGLRGVTTTGTGTSTVTRMSPFVRGIQQAPGQFISNLGSTSAAGNFFF